jgi:hypothetical protein
VFVAGTWVFRRSKEGEKECSRQMGRGWMKVRDKMASMIMKAS